LLSKKLPSYTPGLVTHVIDYFQVVPQLCLLAAAAGRINNHRNVDEKFQNLDNTLLGYGM